MKIEDFTYKFPNEDLPWRLFMPENANKEYCVLWLQGWTSSMDSHRQGVERMSNITGIPFATLDYAGHGKHQVALQDSMRKQQHEEVVAIFDELKKLSFEKIIVIGGSFGGYMAALLSGVRSVEAIVLRAPAIYPDEEFTSVHSKTQEWQNPTRDQSEKANDPYISDNMAVRSVAKFDGFTYVIEHELDEAVPRIMPKAYFTNAKHGNYLIVPRTMHSPKNMQNPQPHFDYIEHLVISIVKAIQLQNKLN